MKKKRSRRQSRTPRIGSQRIGGTRTQSHLLNHRWGAVNSFRQLDFKVFAVEKIDPAQLTMASGCQPLGREAGLAVRPAAPTSAVLCGTEARPPAAGFRFASRAYCLGRWRRSRAQVAFAILA